MFLIIGRVHYDLHVIFSVCHATVFLLILCQILDFGLARQADSEMTGYVVTRWYRAPEVILSWMHYTQTGNVELITRTNPLWYCHLSSMCFPLVPISTESLCYFKMWNESVILVYPLALKPGFLLQFEICYISFITCSGQAETCGLQQRCLWVKNIISTGKVLWLHYNKLVVRVFILFALTNFSV